LVIRDKEKGVTTRSSKNAAIVGRNLFSGKEAKRAATKAYIAPQELVNQSRYPKRPNKKAD
jgi:hypothetical protein